MTYYDPFDSIAILGLSRRCSNALCHAGFLQVGQFVQLTVEQLHAIPNLGQKSIDEILACIEVTQVIAEDFPDRTLLAPTMQNVTLFRDADGILREDIPLDKLNLPVRAVNCLNAKNIKFASQLIAMTQKDVLSIRNMGKITAQQIWDSVQAISFQIAEKTQNTSSAHDQICRDTIDQLKQNLSFHAGTVYAELSKLAEEYTVDNGFWTRVFAISHIRNALKVKALQVCENAGYGSSYEEICTAVPELSVSCGALGSVLKELASENLIWTTDEDTIARKYPSITEYATAILQEKGRHFILGRLEGATLEELGQQNGLTRERVRQIVKKHFDKRPTVAEDRYAEVFRAYNWSKEDFMLAFKETEKTFNYLLMAFDRPGSGKIEDLPADTLFPISFRKAAERAIYKNCITIGNERIFAKRTEIVDFILRTYCNEDMSFDDFVKLYENLIAKFGLQNNPQFELHARTYSNRLADSRRALWKHGKRFRYYDIDQYDFAELLDTLSLNNYQNVEYSTLKFLREYPTLMKNYNIRDEYELHNLLKKICTVEEYPELSFKRMPNIEFGQADRNEQVINLLLQLAPVSATDFAMAYEQEYGVLSQTVLANFVACIDEYFFDGMYKIDLPTLPSEHNERLKTLLTKDFYRTEDVLRLYLKEFPSANQKNINPYTLKTLGFKVYIGYIINARYASATDYFRSLLVETNLVNLRKQSAMFSNIVSFYSELYKAKGDFEIVEYAPLQFVNIRKLREVGITKEMLREYAEDVRRFCSHNECFTIKSLKNGGFSHELDALGFDDWFYASLLTKDREHFVYCRAGGTKVFRKGKTDFSTKDFIMHIIARETSIDIEELISMFYQEFGFQVDRWKIIELVNESSMHYSPIMEKVYIDYDTYFEEV